GERAAIYYYNDTVIAQGNGFAVYADPARNAIIAEIDRDLLLDVEHIEEWKYVVALASYDGFGPLRVRPVGVEAEEWVVGGGRELAKAILAGIEPRVMDLLAPTAEEQYEMLSSFNVERKTVAIVKALTP
ncbi:MAG: pullulanase, partial [Thermoprotei archaeon]